MLEQGLRYDLVEAVLATRGDDPFMAKQSTEALAKWVGKDSWTLMLDGYARCVRIVREIKEPLPLDVAKDKDPHTQALFKAYAVAQKAVGPGSTIDEFFTALTPLIEPITAFFDKVLVMHGDPAIRATRQALLQRIWHLADGVVDLTKVEGF